MYQGKIALVTGSSRGIGRQLCEYFLEMGATVIGFSRSETSLTHDRYRHFSLDISNGPAVAEAFRVIRNEMGKLDILVNNAGVLTSQFAMLTPDTAAEAMLKTNVLGAFHVSKEAAKLMMTKKFGRIISFSSMAVPLSPAGDAMYSASKAALAQFTRVFAKEVSAFGITANVLGITAIESDMMAQIPKEALSEIFKNLPIKRHATMEEIKYAVDFFVSPRAGAITAQTLYLGGVF